MSISTSIPTKLPLATFAKILGIHPLHFEGVNYTPDDRSANICSETLMQYAWQESDKIGREEVAQAIADAEDMMENRLGWRLIPTWEADEWRMTARSHVPEFAVYNNRDVRGRSSVVKSKWGYVLTGGVEIKTALELGANITWSDEDGDGDNDTGTVVVAVTSAVEECEVEAYYPGHSGLAEYQIRPINVEISGGNATITFRRELVVAEELLESLEPRGAVWETDGDFLAEIDVYRHYNDPATQVTLMWEPNNSCGSCNELGCTSCQYSVQTGCLHLRSEPREGLLGYTPGSYDSTTGNFTVQAMIAHRTPDIARLYYRAGYVAPRGCPMAMDMKWARTVTYLAASLLDRPMCSCMQEKWAWWREDLALLSGGEGSQNSTYSFESRKAAGENPFGTRRGALYAWTRVAKDPGVARVDSATW